MEDIEDLFKHGDQDTEERIPQSKRKIIRKYGVKKDGTNDVNGDQIVQEQIAGKEEQSLQELDSQIEGVVINAQKFQNNVQDQPFEQNEKVPGAQKIFVKTYGCSHNISDSEYMAGLLAEYGYQIVDNMDEADACLLNSCTVKNPSQEKFVNLVLSAKGKKKPVIVSGCVPQGDRNIKGLEDVSVIGITQIDRVVEVVEEALKGHNVKLLAKKDLPILDLPKIRKNQLVEIIPLSTGCLGSCTYCKTRHARGKLGSYDPNAIVERARTAIEEGVMEIWLTSEDTGAYGRDIGTSLPELLKSLIAVMPKHTMLRVGMTNPPYILEHLQAMADILNHPRVYSFLHVPVQAASNSVLDKMNREYLIEEFEEVCDFLVENVKDMTLATDIICGFPTETEADFDETLKLVGKYKFPVLNISQFYPRPGTVAAKWKKVPSQDVKKRSNDLTKLFDSYTTNNHYIGTEQLVWIVSFDDRKKAMVKGELPQLMGHTKSYTKVVINQDADSLANQPAASLIGKCVKIHVTETHKWHISGYILDASPELPEVPVDYFERLEKQKIEQEKTKQSNSGEGKSLVGQTIVASDGKSVRIEIDAKGNEIEVEEVIETIVVKHKKDDVNKHMLGMAVMTLGLFIMLRYFINSPILQTV
eukprot:403368709